MLLYACSEAVESKLAKLETSRTVILSPYCERSLVKVRMIKDCMKATFIIGLFFPLGTFCDHFILMGKVVSVYSTHIFSESKGSLRWKIILTLYYVRPLFWTRVTKCLFDFKILLKRANSGVPPKLSGFVCAYLAGFESQTHHLCFLSFIVNLVLYLSWENKQKRPGFGPFNKNGNLQPLFRLFKTSMQFYRK